MKLLLILHGICGIAICALSYHIFFWILSGYRQKNILFLGYIYPIARIWFLLTILQMVIAVLIYPKYRVFVRGSNNLQTQKIIEKSDTSKNSIYFDRDFKAGTFLFELKEHYGALFLAIVGYILLYLKNCIRDNKLPSLSIFIFLFFSIFISTFNTIIGLYLTSIKSI